MCEGVGADWKRKGVRETERGCYGGGVRVTRTAIRVRVGGEAQGNVMDDWVGCYSGDGVNGDSIIGGWWWWWWWGGG